MLRSAGERGRDCHLLHRRDLGGQLRRQTGQISLPSSPDFEACLNLRAAANGLSRGPPNLVFPRHTPLGKPPMAESERPSRQDLVVPPRQSSFPLVLGALLCAGTGFGLVMALGIGRSSADRAAAPPRSTGMRASRPAATTPSTAPPTACRGCSTRSATRCSSWSATGAVLGRPTSRLRGRRSSGCSTASFSMWATMSGAGWSTGNPEARRGQTGAARCRHGQPDGADWQRAPRRIPWHDRTTARL